MPRIPKAEFSEHFDHSTVDGLIDHFYHCNLPFYTIAHHFCQLTFDDAVYTHYCHFAALSHYFGSPEEAECRETCCPDSSMCGADNITEKKTLCKNPVLDQTLKDNGCLKACLARFLIRYGKHHCRSEAVRVFEVYNEVTEKKFLNDDQCFMKCPKTEDS
uniref:Chondroitin proteoglycan 4 domain-containing protein n=1 Tax=Panagrellus redivivus TaxID=6233 RepID=A0A7E4V3V5_PANRE